MVNEKSTCKIASAFCTENCMEKYSEDIALVKENCDNFYLVSNDVLKAISDTVTPQGVVCVAKMCTNDFEYESGKKYIALDTVQNPDNLGAISRTAEAFGIDGMIIFVALPSAAFANASKDLSLITASPGFALFIISIFAHRRNIF